EDRRFGAEAAQRLRVSRIGTEDLDRDLAVERRVERLVNDTRGAAADLRLNPILADRRLGHSPPRVAVHTAPISVSGREPLPCSQLGRCARFPGDAPRVRTCSTTNRKGS